MSKQIDKNFEIFKKILHWWPLVFYCTAPFVAFLFFSFKYPEFIGQTAFLGWLAIILYVYFLVGRYAEKNISSLSNSLISSFLIPVILIISQFLKPNFSWENYFSELMILEVSVFVIGLVLFFIFNLRQAIKEGMGFIVFLAVFFIAFSCLSVFSAFLIMWLENNLMDLWPAFWTILGIFIVKLINELRWFLFFRKNYLAKRNTGFDASAFDNNPMLIIGALVLWMAGIPLLHFLLEKIF